MFILRSAFWLGVAFLLVKPAHLDLAQSGQSLAAQTISATKSLATAGIDAVPCQSLECAGVKSVAKLSLAAHAANAAGSGETRIAQNTNTVPPLPRPRMARPG